MKLVLKRILLILWVAVSVFPVVGLGWLYPGFLRRFNDIFHSHAAHVLLHAALFAGLVILLLAAFDMKLDRRAVAVSFLAILVVAGLQELLQALSQGFFPFWGALYDLGTDFLGGALGFGLYYIFFDKRQEIW
jgi:glycopeptide antibiotics resistance protein